MTGGIGRAVARSGASVLALAIGLAVPLDAWAHDKAPPPIVAPAATTKSFTPADFARFAPTTGYDMLVQVPGFTIRTADTTRGLGQASENVLVNGQRVIDKAGGAVALLQKVPAADVIRIEVSEAATLGIAGLTGQVANVVLKADRKGSGTYSWSPQVRAHYAKPRWLKGAISYSGISGDLGYTVSLEDQPGRGALGGNDYRILAPDGTLVERRDQVVWNNYDDAKLSAIFKYGGTGGVQANLTLDYDPYWQVSNNYQRRVRFDGDSNDWNTHTHDFGFQYDVSGDVSVPLGGGRIKLIGLRHFQHDPTIVDQRTDYDSGRPSDGTLYGLDQRIGETIARLEYHWKGAHNDWTLSFERARNSLAQVSTLASLQPDGRYAPIAFPQGTGTVVETRYEGLAALTRPLSRTLDLQLAAGAEASTLGEVDQGARRRQFFRPKGSASLAWRPAAGWDVSLKVERRVGQISFSDFLANQDITNDRGNDANPNLVPPQSWEATGELGRILGRWGKTRLKLYRYAIDDIVDHVPVGVDGDAVGNLPHATRTGIESISTIQFDPVGWRGAKLDADVGIERGRVRDPLTGLPRAISNTRDRFAELTLRHDVPHSQFAWGAGLSYEHYGLTYYLDEVSQNWEGPYSSVFVELKKFHGLKLHGEVFNLNNGRVRYYRDVYGGRRTASPLSFLERQHQLVGPLFSLSVSGSF